MTLLRPFSFLPPVLQGHIQTINGTEEVGIAVSCNASGAFGHKVVGTGQGVAAEFREHIGNRGYIVQHARGLRP